MKSSVSCLIVRFTLAVLVVAAAAILPAAAQPCVVPDNGGGTVNLPPAGCGYVSPDDLHIMIDGLPAGTTIRVAPEHFEFFNVITIPGGGGLGGDAEQFQSQLCMDMEGTGLLLGFNRFICLPLTTETHTGPRNAGDPVQTFPTEMFLAQGEIFGDPDFDLLRVQAGQGFGLPSPGETTLTDIGGGNFNVDSFFDITYTIEFQGAPGSVLEGMGGTTTDTVRMGAGEPADPNPNPCTSPDDSTGTAVLPPPGCEYLSPQDFHIAVENTDPGTTLIIDASHNRFLNPTVTPGGNLGGRVETFGSNLDLHLTGTGLLAGFDRNVSMSALVETHTGPTGSGDSQMFPNEMVALQGEIFGDPDFDLLRITAGSGHGLPSSGMTTLTRLPSGNFNVDSFFDITYTIEFQGAPGGALDGMSGNSTGDVRMSSGGPPGGSCPPIPAGLDVFPSTATLVLQPFLTGGPPIKVRLSSANQPDSVVQRGTQSGRTIPVEMVALSLRGSHPDLGGEILVQLDPAQQSLGQLTDVHQDPVDCHLISADSFFDVYTEISLTGLGETWTAGPLHLESHIDQIPPVDAQYENPFVDPVTVFGPSPGICSLTPLTCFNDNNCPPGETCIPGPPQPVAEIVYERHHVNPPPPPPQIDCFDTWLDAELQIDPLGQQSFPIQLQGPTSVSRGSDDGTGSWQTEIVSMDLSGSSPKGKVKMKVKKNSPTKPPSTGKLTSKVPGRTYPVDSFFDVFTEISLQDQGFNLRNEQPVRVQGIGSSGIDGFANLPPDPNSRMQQADTCSQSGEPCNTNADCPQPGEVCGIPLVADDGTPVGTIKNVNHTIHPPFDWQPPPPPDDYCFDSWLHLRITVFNPFCEEEVWLPGIFRVVRGGPQGIGAAIMNTLMAKSSFRGSTLCTGALSAQLNPDQSSTGQIAGLTPAEFYPADSFFDVWVELDTGIGRLTAGGPTHMTTTINNLPPDEGEIYFGPGTVIPIFGPTGQQLGEILEVSHQVHQRIECPFDQLSRITFQLTDAGDPGGAPGSTEALAAESIFVTLPGGGGGLSYDVIGGDFSSAGPFPAGFPGHTCLQDNGNGVVVDPAPAPALGMGRYYVARELFDTFVGSWNGGGAQSGDRDLAIIACP